MKKLLGLIFFISFCCFASNETSNTILVENKAMMPAVSNGTLNSLVQVTYRECQLDKYRFHASYCLPEKTIAKEISKNEYVPVAIKKSDFQNTKFANSNYFGIQIVSAKVDDESIMAYKNPDAKEGENNSPYTCAKFKNYQIIKLSEVKDELGQQKIICLDD